MGIKYIKGNFNHAERGGQEKLPKVVDYEEKKQEIIEKARIVFTKRGYHNTSLSHISKKMRDR